MNSKKNDIEYTFIRNGFKLFPNNNLYIWSKKYEGNYYIEANIFHTDYVIFKYYRGIKNYYHIDIDDVEIIKSTYKIKYMFELGKKIREMIDYFDILHKKVIIGDL